MTFLLFDAVPCGTGGGRSSHLPVRCPRLRADGQGCEVVIVTAHSLPMDASGFPYDYFISLRGSVAALAREAAAVLEAAGHRSASRTMTSPPPATSCATSTMP